MDVSADDQLWTLSQNGIANRLASANLPAAIAIDGVKRRRMNDQHRSFGTATQQLFTLLLIEVVAPVAKRRYRDATSHTPEVDSIDLAPLTMKDPRGFPARFVCRLPQFLDRFPVTGDDHRRFVDIGENIQCVGQSFATDCKVA